MKKILFGFATLCVIAGCESPTKVVAYDSNYTDEQPNSVFREFESPCLEPDSTKDGDRCSSQPSDFFYKGDLSKMSEAELAAYREQLKLAMAGYGEPEELFEEQHATPIAP